MRNLGSALLGMAAAALLAGSAPAAEVLDVEWNTGCGKTTCFNEAGVFTQTFSADAFSGPVTIGQLLLDRGVLGALDGSTFRISFALNGEELGSWGHFNMGAIGGDQLGVQGFEFTWNPEDGDLVLVLALSPPPKPGGGGLSLLAVPEGEEGGLTPGFVPDPDRDPEGGPQGGPPGGVQPGAIPEPSTWALLIAGFGLAGAALRRRRTALKI